MNKYKEAYKEEIVSDIVDKYVKLDISISNSPSMANALDQKLSTLKYMKNLIKTITAEEEEEIDHRIKEGYIRFRNTEEEED